MNRACTARRSQGHDTHANSNGMEAIPDMKKHSVNAPKSAQPKASAATQLARGAASSSPAATATAGCLRLELLAPATLAVLEPAARPGVVTPRRVRFGYFKPEAHAVHLVGTFNGWDPQVTPMHRDALGDWSVELDLPPGEHRYRFCVDGAWRDDPAAPQTAQNPFGGFDAVMVVV